MINFRNVTRKFIAAGVAAVLFSLSVQKMPVLATSDGKVSFSMVGKYDSADTAAIRAIDTDNKQIRFRNHSTGKTYTLNYDNTSMIYDIRGTALSAQLLEVGQIVDVTFLKSTKHITTLNVSDEAWTIDSTKDHDLVRNDGTARVKGEVYKLNNKTLVLADGELALAENVLSTDKIKVSGIGKEIYSVIVTSGHGYVSLSSDTVEDQSLVGAWIELDNDVIHKISPNMLLSAPEGDYTLQILGNGANYQSKISISRNQETVVDTSNITITKPKEGLVTFEIVPQSAEVFVDGEKVLTAVPQSIQYGYHNLKIMADGYITQNRYLKVGTAKSVVSIELEKDEDDSEASSSSTISAAASTTDKASSKASKDKTSSGSSSSKKSSSASTATTISSNSSSSDATNVLIEGYKIYFDAPNGAELYFDGSYVGIVPTNVPKISGSHEVILKQSGYLTKSYRIKIDKDKSDVKYEFPAMIKEQSDSSADSSTKGSSSSDSSSSSSSDSSGDASSDASSEASSDSGSDSSSDSGSESSSEASGEASSSKSDSSEDSSLNESDKKDSSSEKSSASTGKTTGDSDKPSDAASASSGAE